MPTKTDRWRVACFDLDGTLVMGTTICRHLGQHFSHGEIIRELDTKYAEGMISNRQIAEAEANLFEGVLQTEVESGVNNHSFHWRYRGNFGSAASHEHPHSLDDNYLGIRFAACG